MSDTNQPKRKPRQISRAGLLKAALGGTAGMVGGASLASLSDSPLLAAEAQVPDRVPHAAHGNVTNLLVRAQARGGKYLGDDIGGALVTIRDVQSNRVLASGATSGDAGNLVTKYSPGASHSVVVTPARPPVVRWLVPDVKTSSFKARLTIDRPTLLEIAVQGPIGGLQTSQHSAVTRWVRPNEDVEVTVDIPGLLLQVMEPATHLQLIKPGGVVPLQAKVAMMCGCPIQPGMPWLPGDFEVFARIRRLPSTPIADVRLKFASVQTPGIFIGQFRVKAPGFYAAAVDARQLSTGNFGLGEVTFFTAPPAP
jgi:hypothetical protein